MEDRLTNSLLCGLCVLHSCPVSQNIMFIQRSFYNLCRKRATFRSIPKQTFQSPYVFKNSRLSNSVTTVVEPPPSTIYPPFAKYAHAVVTDMHSNVVFTSGQLGIAPDGSIPSSAYEQAKLCFQNIDCVLKESATKTENEFERHSDE